MATNNVQYIIGLQDRMSPKLGAIQKKTSALGGAMNKLGGIMAGVFAATAMFKFFDNSIKAWDKQTQAIAQVQQGLESTGNQIGKTLEELTKSASDFQSKTIFGDEDILKGVTSQLLTFTNITGKNFNRVQQSILDVTTRIKGANASGEDLTAMSLMLGKALNDPVANLGALSRSGIQFSKDQKATIKALVEGGKAGEAQALVLKELEKQYGGSAAAARKAGLGGLKAFKNTLGDIQEVLGGKIAPSLLKFVDFLQRVIKNANPIKKAFNEITKVFSNLFSEIGRLISSLGLFNSSGDKAITFVSIFSKLIKLASIPIKIIISSLTLFIKAINYILNRFPVLKLGVMEIIKVFKLLIKSLINLPDTLGALTDSFITWMRSVKKLFGDTFGSIGKLLSESFNFKKLSKGDFSGLTSALGGLKKPFEEFGEDAGQSFTKSLAERIAKRKTIQLNNSGVTSTGTSLGSISGNLSSGVSSVGSTAPKTFNINIDSLIEKLNINSTNLREGAAEMKTAVTRTLLDALNDSQIQATQ